MYALCKSTLSGGLQAEAMAFGRISSKLYTFKHTFEQIICSVKVH